jgi:hypothetical protein
MDMSIPLSYTQLLDKIQKLESTLKVEREEYKDFFNHVKEKYVLKDDYDNAYVNEEYFKESQYIHSLKKQIDTLINQNSQLKHKNQELMQENEQLKTMLELDMKPLKI